MGGIAEIHLVTVQVGPLHSQAASHVPAQPGGEDLGNQQPHNGGYPQRLGAGTFVGPRRGGGKAQARAQYHEDQRQRSRSSGTGEDGSPGNARAVRGLGDSSWQIGSGNHDSAPYEGEQNFRFVCHSIGAARVPVVTKNDSQLNQALRQKPLPRIVRIARTHPVEQGVMQYPQPSGLNGQTARPCRLKQPDALSAHDRHSPSRRPRPDPAHCGSRHALPLVLEAS